MRWLLVAVLAGLLAGCATLLPDSEQTPGAAVTSLNAVPPQQFDLDGRLAVEAGRDSGQASFHWRHGPDFDRLELYSPLGQTLGVLQRDAGGADLVDSHGDVHHGSNLAALLDQWMGWPLPVDEMSSWMVGAAAPGHPYHWYPPTAGESGRLEQSGWRVEYLRWHDGHGHPLPEKVALVAGQVRVKLLVRNWKLVP